MQQLPEKIIVQKIKVRIKKYTNHSNCLESEMNCVLPFHGKSIKSKKQVRRQGISIWIKLVEKTNFTRLRLIKERKWDLLKNQKKKVLHTSFVTTSHNPSLARIRNSRELSTFSSCNFQRRQKLVQTKHKRIYVCMYACIFWVRL